MCYSTFLVLLQEEKDRFDVELSTSILGLRRDAILNRVSRLSSFQNRLLDGFSSTYALRCHSEQDDFYFFFIAIYWRSRRRGLNGTIQCMLQVTEQVENKVTMYRKRKSKA